MPNWLILVLQKVHTTTVRPIVVVNTKWYGMDYRLWPGVRSTRTSWWWPRMHWTRTVWSFPSTCSSTRSASVVWNFCSGSWPSPVFVWTTCLSRPWHVTKSLWTQSEFNDWGGERQVDSAIGHGQDLADHAAAGWKHIALSSWLYLVLVSRGVVTSHHQHMNHVDYLYNVIDCYMIKVKQRELSGNLLYGSNDKRLSRHTQKTMFQGPNPQSQFVHLDKVWGGKNIHGWGAVKSQTKSWLFLVWAVFKSSLFGPVGNHCSSISSSNRPLVCVHNDLISSR